MGKKINTPLIYDQIKELKAGDSVLISGIIYTARDAAHKRLVNLLDNELELPIELENSIIYYVGPTPSKPGMVIGSAGPTTSGRMDKYTPKLLDKGLKGMIGKGARSNEVIESIKKNKAVYFAAIGGAAALISKTIIKKDLIAYEDLGSEAILKLEVKDFPAIVCIDAKGNDIYKLGNKYYLESIK